MNRSSRTTAFYIAAACVAVAAAIFAVIPTRITAVLVALRLGAFLCAIVAVMLLVAALSRKGESPAAAVHRAPPPPPAMPAGLPLDQACLGSLTGALHALPRFAQDFGNNLVCVWQLERCTGALAAILEHCEAGADPTLTADFAVQYLPSAMQYVAACSAEGCPSNAPEDLGRMALACQRQQDALTAGERIDFEQEYHQIRQALRDAEFSWGQ